MKSLFLSGAPPGYIHVAIKLKTVSSFEFSFDVWKEMFCLQSKLSFSSIIESGELATN
jgi:hypothetical protein